MKILLGSCTRHDIDRFQNSELYTSMLSSLTLERTDTAALYTGDIDAAIKINNTEHISKHYNKVLEMGIDMKYDCIILMHDDVSIEDKFLNIKLQSAFQNHDVVGLAGARQVELKQPALWHLMSKQEDWTGAVAHPASPDQVFMTNFGPTPQRCLVLDGLFLAIKVSSLTDGIRFDENIPGIAHHYDIDFSLTCNSHTLKLTTWPIWAVHRSPGLEERGNDFVESEKYFLNKWTR